jgi:predicted AlkP superfamily pyrophosphatase or phosphodiesterase
MNRFILLICFFLHVTAGFAQTSDSKRPKLVVGILVDQMRQEYLYRFYNKFGEGGFKRLVDEGFMLKNAHYNYVPTLTATGHASVYTGTTPGIHGIIGNDWFDKDLKQRVYCASDSEVATVGSTSVAEGKMSPHRLLSTTITDELKLATQKRSKVIGLSIKYRGSILPAGHMADGAYWFDLQTGKFITSTYYTQTLPAWVENFNNLGLPDKYFKEVWSPALPIEKYVESGPDLSPYEAKLKGSEKPVFPYTMATLKKGFGNYEALTYTPFGNTYLTEISKAAIDGEKLGQDEWTDFLSISYSTPDKVGHEFGPNSVEVEDIYIRLDRDLADLFKKLDQSVGAQNYMVFLTSDHAIPDVPQYMIDNRIPAGYMSESNLQARLEEYLNGYYPERKLILDVFNEQIFLNHEAFSDDPRKGGIDLLVTTELISNFLIKEKGIANVFSKNVIRQGNYNEGGYKGMVIRGFHPKRSGDIAYVLEPNWIEYGRVQGTTHGSPYTNDTHVPVLFYGTGIKKGSSSQYHSITDIAPTLSVLLKIKFPNGCTGQPVTELVDSN